MRETGLRKEAAALPCFRWGESCGMPWGSVLSRHAQSGIVEEPSATKPLALPTAVLEAATDGGCLGRSFFSFLNWSMRSLERPSGAGRKAQPCQASRERGPRPPTASSHFPTTCFSGSRQAPELSLFRLAHSKPCPDTAANSVKPAVQEAGGWEAHRRARLQARPPTLGFPAT